MSMWNKIDSFGGLISGVGAMIVAVIAILQSSSNQEDMEQLFQAMEGIEVIFDRQQKEDSASELMAVFRENNWQPMTANQLFKSEMVQGWELPKPDFAQVLLEGMANGFLRVIEDRASDPEDPTLMFIWDPVLKLD